ncbi:MAG: GIY-YIG nuclease family protein [Micromonosporaceae bacterium]
MGTPRAAIAGLPGTPGVYRFRDARGRVLYVGRAADLRHRVGSYWGSLRGRRHLARMVPQIVAIEAVACDSAHEAAWLERNLLERSKPRWNRVRGGLVVPVYIRVRRGPGVARLAVVHGPLEPVAGAARSTVDIYGPYLGGTRARLAVSGLDRVLPLGYTSGRLTGGERDLARIRGIDPADRDALLATLTAVLQRQPAAVEAVTELLVRQRDRAAASLAFELAAQVHQEIEALGWILAEQKVTMPDSPPDAAEPCGPADCDVYGWDGDLLVHFAVRHGRLCIWTQRACSSPAARPYLDRTPVGWRPFAARNAELARRLASAGR